MLKRLEGMIPLLKKDSNPRKILIDTKATALSKLSDEGINQHQYQ